MKIVVLKGGISSEREVSLHSGEKISKALKANGHEVLSIDTVLPIEQIGHNIHPTQQMLENGDANLVKLLNHPEIRSADFIFIALHGGCGENGQLQGVLELMGYAFNGANSESCAITMDKIISKLLFEKYSIPTPEWIHFNHADKLTISEMVSAITQKIALPIVIKPNREGSTVGLSIVKKQEEIQPAIIEAIKWDKELLIEKYIEGRELTVTLLGDKALPVLEIIPKHGIYDYECKYTEGMSQYIAPAKIDSDLAKKIQQHSIKAFQILKCKGYGRIDLMLSKTGKPYFLEMNTMPGMTDTSLVPKSAKAVGISFNQLLEKIIELGLN